MTYLLALQKAIAQTGNLGPCFPENDTYFIGWVDAELDLEYGASLSEQAVKEHIAHWLEDEEMVLNEDKGYLDRIKEINQIIENTLDTPIQSA